VEHVSAKPASERPGQSAHRQSKSRAAFTSALRGAVLEIETENRSYTMEYCGLNQALLSGHPVFCPEPTLVTITGSTWGGSMLKTGYIGRGMRLEFRPAECPPITTSVVREVRSAR
jgi:hypothetical protein